MTEKTNVIWFENDLRVHDHEGLFEAKKSNLPTIGIYIINPKDLVNNKFGFPKIGQFRLRFIYESLLDLKIKLENINVSLYVFVDEHQSVFRQLIKNYDIEFLFTQKSYGSEEIKKQTNIITMFAQPIIRYYDQKPLYHVDDLPMNVLDIPNVFTSFRQQIEKKGIVRKTYPIPEAFEKKTIMVLKDDLNKLSKYIDQSINHILPGGETKAIKRLEYYFFETQKLKVYKLTRNQMLNFDDSSKLSPYLALGCISPRYIYEQIKLYEQNYVKNVSTYWLYFELVWRDYFHFIHVKYKDKLFYKTGLFHKTVNYDQTKTLITAWQEGKTGYPLIDANMIELNQTGWMSNRGRQNVANFFVKYLNQDWRIGAAWFEYLLIDYDVSSNYGNWQYQAGVGVDPREDRLFDVTWQGEKYDQDTRYLRKWLPQFDKIPKDKRYQVMNLTNQEQQQHNFVLGRDYPYPISEKPNQKRKKP